jgi:hypothetical protein
MEHKKIIVIETPPTMVPFKQVTTLMTEEELATAKKERPDLIFRLAEELPSTGDVQIPEDTYGVSVKGMITPGDLLQ